MFFRRLHPVPLIAGLVVAVITVQLGNWQTRRAEYKLEIQQRIQQYAGEEPVPFAAADEDPPEWSRLRIKGEWVPDAVMYLDNRVHQRRAGYHVLMPLRLDGDAGWVLVNRGWIAGGLDRQTLPEVNTPSGEVEVSGTVTLPEKEPFTLAADAREGLRWQFVDVDAHRAWSGLAVRDWVLMQDSPARDGLVREWTTPDTGIDKHRGYAVQWYSLAGLSLALTGFYVFRSFRAHAA